MRKVSQSLDYMTKDYEGFRKLMLNAIPTILPEWTDLSEEDFGVVLIELLAYGLDILSYYQDKAYNESFLATARTRRAVLNICRNVLGYTMKQAVPARFIIVFKKLKEFLNQEIVIPSGTLIGTDPKMGNQVVFEVDKTITLPPGALGDEVNEEGNYIYGVTATHGVTVREELGFGTGEPSQKIKLAKSNILIDTLKVWSLDNGVIRDWEQVDDFLSSDPNSRHYIALMDENKLTNIEFGDGLSGLKPSNTQPFYALYRVGGGTIGNVGQRKINSFVSSEIVGIGEIFNPDQPMQYGLAEESLSSAKILAPKMFQTNDRAVTVTDFEVLACRVPGVLRAKAIETFNENGDVIVYVSTADRGITSNEFKKEVKDYIEARMLVNSNVIIKDAEYKDYDVDVIVVTYPEYSNDYVRSIAEHVIADELNINEYDFDDDINKSLINKKLMMQTCIFDVIINEPSENVVTTKIQIPRLRNISVEVKGGLK